MEVIDDGGPTPDLDPTTGEGDARSVPPGDAERGTPASPDLPPVAIELRQRRKLLRLSQAEVARRARVARQVVNEIENGRRIPELRTYEKLRGLLGLAPASSVLARPAPPPRFSDDHLTRLCACVLAARHALLADLADALHVSVPAVREGLLALSDRLAGVGFRAWEDGAAVRLEPIPAVADAVAEVTSVDPLRPLSEEQLAVLMVVAHLGAATRQQVESWRCEDSESLLERLVAKGFLDKARDAAPRKPNVFRLTTAALAASGFPTLEAFQAYLASLLSPSDKARLEAWRSGLAGAPVSWPA